MRRSGGRARAAGCSTASSTTDVTTTYVGSSTGPAAAARPADRPLRLHRQDRRPDQQCLGRRSHPRLRRRRRARARGRARAAARLGVRAASTCRPAATTRSCRRRRGRPDDRRLLVRRRARRARRAVGVQPPGRRHPGRRAGGAARGHPLLRPGVPRLGVRATRRGRVVRQRRFGLRHRPPAGTHRMDRRRHAVRAPPDSRNCGAHRPSGDADDRQPGPRRRRRDADPWTTSWPPPSAGCC